MDHFAQISLLVFGILMLVGGMIGFLKSKSKASLFAGLVSGALLITAHSVSNRNTKTGYLFGMGVCSVLSLVFVIRLAKTKKFMPAGLLLLLSVIEELFLLLATFSKA